MTAYYGLDYECAICTRVISVMSDWARKNQKVFNRQFESKHVCYECYEDLSKHICKTPGCRVLKGPDSSYCSRHDETSVVEIEKPKLQEEDLE